MAKKPSKELAPKGSNDISTDAVDFLSQHAGKGMEHVTMADMVMPRVNILQDLSPQLKPNKPEYVEGAKRGQIFNAATRRVADEIHVIPCAYIRHHIEWKPNRGGFVADHGEAGEALLAQCKRNADNYDVLPNGNLLVPTGTWYCLDLDNAAQQIVIPMSRTQLKPSRQWMSAATSEKIKHPENGEFTPPLWFRSWGLHSVLREDGENDWYVFAFDRGPTIIELDDPSLIEKARSFQELVSRGEVRADANAFADDGQGVGSNRNDEERAM
jgi:hypothetical protein